MTIDVPLTITSGNTLIARQERQRISERVLAGLARAKRENKDLVLGRPKVVVSTTKIRKLAEQGFSAVQIGEQLGVSRMTAARRLAAGG